MQRKTGERGKERRYHAYKEVLEGGQVARSLKDDKPKPRSNGQIDRGSFSAQDVSGRTKAPRMAHAQ